MCKLIDKCEKCIADNPGTYQIYLTFSPDNQVDLIESCERLLVNLYSIKSGNKLEWISSSNHKTQYPIEELHILESALKNHNIIRSKIEKPFKIGEEGLYHETHWTFSEFPKFDYKSLGLVLSSNIQNGKYYLTYRCKYDTTLHYIAIHEFMERMGNSYIKYRSETCLYDNNETLDDDWIKNK